MGSFKSKFPGLITEKATWQNIAAYEQKHHAIPPATPAMVIRMLMQDRGLKNKDLEPVLGSSGVMSEVIPGKRNPRKAQVKALAQFFQVSLELFVAIE